VIRTVDGFHQDDAGDWVAELSCLHNQHVRHRPPFWDRPWVLDEEGRAGRIGAPIECPLCDRAELPDGLEMARVAGPFDQTTVPRGLLRDHHVAERTWGVLEVLDGAVSFEMATEPPTVVRLSAGERQAIPPAVAHRVSFDGAARIQVVFLVRPPERDRPPPT
jgi:tellurite resistance-related uncharacterized protein